MDSEFRFVFAVSSRSCKEGRARGEGDGDTSVGGRTDGAGQSGKENIVSFSAFCSTVEEVFRALKGGYKKSPENGRREDSRSC